MSARPEEARAMKRVIVDALVANKVGHLTDPEALPDDMPLGPEGLGVSSLLLLHIFVRLEEALGFTFEDAAVANARFATVRDVLDFSSEAARRRAEAG